MQRGIKLLIGGIVATLLLFTVLFLPHLQPVFYTMFIENIEVLWWVLIGGAISAVIAFAEPVPDEYQGTLLKYTVVFTFLMALFVGPMIAEFYAKGDIANNIEMNVDESELPDTSEESVRVLPRSVADNFASSSLQEPQYRLSQSEITEINGTYYWTYGLIPDNLGVAIGGNQNGSMYVSMEQADKNVTIDKKTFNNGRGQLFTDSYKYRNILDDPFKNHRWGTAFNSEYNGREFIAHSTVSHEWRFNFFPIPQPYTVPTHGSVEVTYPNGDHKEFTPEEAANSEMFSGENVYPYSVARYRVTATQYEQGVLNKIFFKDGVLSIADLPEGGNSWPLTVPTQDGNDTELTYFIATEPAGSGDGVFEVWTIDGRTGELGFNSYDTAQIGPQKAVQFVERQSEVNRLSNADVVAPVPIVKNNTLYWHTKVIPSQSNTGIIYTAFVNAQSGNVTLVEGTNQVYAFLTQEQVEEIDDGSNQNGNDTDGQAGRTVTVVVTNSEGDITGTREITIPEGGSIQIELQGSGNRTAN